MWCRFLFWHGTPGYLIGYVPVAFGNGFCKGRVPFLDYGFQTAIGIHRFTEFITYLFFKIPRTTCARALRIRHPQGDLAARPKFFNTRFRSSDRTGGRFMTNETIHCGCELEQCSGVWLSDRNVTGRIPPFRPFL